jgi:hypothetical protein
MTTQVKPSVELREVLEDSGKTRFEAYNPANGLVWESEGVTVGGAQLEDSVENAVAFAATNGLTFKYPDGWFERQQAAKTAPIAITDVRRLDVRPGDTIVVRADRKGNVETWTRAIDEFKRWYPDVHVIVVPNDADISVLAVAIEDGVYVRPTSADT